MHISNTCCCHALPAVALGFLSLSGDLSAYFNSIEGESSTLEFPFLYQRHLSTRNKLLRPEVIDAVLKMTGDVERKVVLRVACTHLIGGARVRDGKLPRTVCECKRK
jgi:hypothetical protein